MPVNASMVWWATKLTKTAHWAEGFGFVDLRLRSQNLRPNVLNLKTHKSDMLCTSAEICSSDYKSAERTKKCLKLWRVSWHMCHSLLGSCNFFAWPQRIKCCLFSSFLNFLWYSVWVPKWVAAWSGSGFCWGTAPFVSFYLTISKKTSTRGTEMVFLGNGVLGVYPDHNFSYFSNF